MNANIQHNLGQPNDPANKDVFSTLSDALHRFFYFRVHDNEIAADLAQETIARTLKARSELFDSGREGEFRAYLYATARHVFANYIRDQQRHQTGELTESSQESNTAIDIQSSIDAELLWRQITKLSVIEQNVLRLQFQQGLSIHQIARKLHKSTNAIKLISSRARTKLKKMRKNIP